MKKPHRTTPDSMEEEKQELTDTDPSIFTATSDLCQQLLDRYGKSSAPQHRHLCATAAATRSILQSESLPLTPLSYFAAAIDAVSVKTLDSDAVSALSAFLGIVLPLVPDDSIAPEKAADAVAVIVEMVERRPSEAAVSAPGVRALVKCLGVLVGFCDLEDWESVKLGFQTLLKFSIDKRPKVRRCAQDCVLKAFKSFKSSAVIKDASKYVLFMLKGYMPLAATISAMRAKDGYKDETLLKPEDLAVLHFLNVLKLVVPCLSVKVNLRVLAQLHKLMSSQFSALTRHIFGIIETMFETPEGEVAAKEVENIIESLASYIFLGEKNPSDTILSAATLSKSALDKLYTDEPTKWISNLPLVVGSVVGLLTSETSASQASVVIKELINQLTDTSDFSNNVGQPVDDEVKFSKESKAIESMCSIFHNVLSACGGIPNEHILAVISVLFIKLGKRSYFYMKSILLELAEVMTIACRKFDRKHLEECIGSAVSAIGPEKILALIPISFNAEDRTCSNIWLVPILKNYVVGSSLGFFMQHVVPLAESLQRACQKVKKSEIGEDLQAHARGCWGLLSAFCRGPTDTYENFGPLVKLLIPFLTKDSWMLENVAIALQELVNENRSAPGSNQRAGEFEKVTNTSGVNNSLIELKCRSSYSKKIARRNIKALASCSEELLQAIADVLFDSPPEKHTYLKDAIGCLASITDSAVIKKIFITSLERFQLMDSSGEYGKIGGHSNVSIDKVHGISTSAANRCLILELASSLVGGASEDLIGIIYSFVKHTLQGTDENAEHEAYYTLSRILEDHSWFCTSQFIELMDFLLGLKAPVDVASLRSRFACFQILLIHAIKRSSDEENAKAFLILNEIIVTIKDSKEEGRKAAYDILLGINSSLRDSSSAISDGPYHKLISMIMGYLSSSSPQIKSGAVSALSVLVHNNADICLVIPDLVPSVLALLQTKAVEVIKAALGFVKVLVSCLEARDLHKILPDAISGVLSWSSISRHHFRAKVTVILEIMMRKCGAVAVESLAPQKYSSFVKSVSEGRHGKTNSKETGSNDAQNKLSDSSARGSFRQQNRKCKESNISPEEDGLREPRKRKWENPQKGNAYRTREPHIDSGSGNGAKGAKRPRYSNHDKSNECLSQGGSRNSRGGSRNGRNFNKDSSSSGKRTEQSKGNKKNEAADHRNFNPSKFTKHKRVARKGQNFIK